LRASLQANTGEWDSFIKLAFSNQELSSLIGNALLSNIPISSLQKINPHEVSAGFHAAAARLQLQWTTGLVSDVGFMRVAQLLLHASQAILDANKHLPPFVAAWRRVCSTAESIVQHTSHVLLMETGYQEEAAAGVFAAAASIYPHIPRGHVHFAYRSTPIFQISGEHASTLIHAQAIYAA
jgi:hypothetical protein